MLQLFSQEGTEAVFGFRPHLVEDILAEFTGLLHVLNLGCHLLDKGDLAPVFCFGECWIEIIMLDGVSATHEQDFSGRIQTNQQQCGFLFRPAMRTVGEATVTHVIHHNLSVPARLRCQVDVAPYFLQRLRVVFRQSHLQCLLTGIVALQDGVDFLQRVVVQVLEVAQFCERVFNEVLQRCFHRPDRVAGIDFQFLAGHEVTGLNQHVTQHVRQQIATLLVFSGQVFVDAASRWRGGAVVFGPDVLVRPQIGF